VLKALGNRDFVPEDFGSPWRLTRADWAIGLQFGSSPVKSPLGLALEKLRQRLDECPCVQHVVLDGTNHMDLFIVFGLGSWGRRVGFRPTFSQ
jgi:hypothetical protein